VRIAIVNDSLMAVEALRRVLQQAPEHQLAWVARDGAEALERCRQDRPDLVLMDLLMPVMDGVEATRQIMAQAPCAILIVTATMDGHAARVFEALGAGALDAISTPLPAEDGNTRGATPLLSKLRMMEQLVTREIRHPQRPDPQPGPPRNRQLLVMGASAGGPGALATILRALPHDFPAPIIIVQHVDASFAPAMASWLNDQSALPVSVAQQGDQAQAGRVLLAGTNDHLVFVNPHSLGYTPEPLDCAYRPSVDIFFDSVVAHRQGQIAGVLLTGMGRDGARGLKALRDAGALTIAQDRATSVVYGMPKAAAQLGAAVKTLPLDRIAPWVDNYFARAPEAPGP
jgi:two-component system response regulator WspF